MRPSQPEATFRLLATDHGPLLLSTAGNLLPPRSGLRRRETFSDRRIRPVSEGEAEPHRQELKCLPWALMKDRPEETTDAAEESAVLGLGLQLRWWRLNHRVNVHRPLGRFFYRQSSRGLDGCRRRSRTIFTSEDERSIHLNGSVVGLRRRKRGRLRTVRQSCRS